MTTAFDSVLERTPDVVLWDMDNTLYAYDPAHETAMESVRRRCEVRLALAGADFTRAFEQARNDVKQQLKGTASSHSRILYFQRLIEIASKKTDSALSLELEKTYWRRFMSTARLLPGARDTIDELRYAHIPLVLVTDLTTQVQMRKLVRFELDGVFDVIVTSEEVGVDKPDPRIFLRALEKIGVAKEHSTIWMIGDSAERDVLGAKAAVSAVTFQKLHHGVKPSPDADATIDEFTPFADAIRQRLARSSSKHA